MFGLVILSKRISELKVKLTNIIGIINRIVKVTFYKRSYSASLAVKGLVIILMPECFLPTTEELCFRSVLDFFLFHSKSGTTNNHLNGSSDI